MFSQAIKSIFPEVVVKRYDNAVDKLILAKLPTLKFEGENLRCRSTFNLSRIFNDPDLNAAWESDYVPISSIYQNKEMFLGVNPGDRRAIYYLIMALRPRNVLEIGTHIGASTIHIAVALKRLDEGGH